LKLCLCNVSDGRIIIVLKYEAAVVEWTLNRNHRKIIRKKYGLFPQVFVKSFLSNWANNFLFFLNFFTFFFLVYRLFKCFFTYIYRFYSIMPGYFTRSTMHVPTYRGTKITKPLFSCLELFSCSELKFNCILTWNMWPTCLPPKETPTHPVELNETSLILTYAYPEHSLF